MWVVGWKYRRTIFKLFINNILVRIYTSLCYVFINIISTPNTYPLHIEKWRPIFKLILANDANGFKNNFVLLYTVTEAYIKTFEVFDSRIEGFVAEPSTTLELPYFWCVLTIWHADDGLFSFIAIVSYCSFTAWDFRLELLAEHRDIVFSSWARTFNPNKFVFENSNR